MLVSSDVEEGGAGGAEPPSSDLRGVRPPNSTNFLEIGAYKNQYSVVKGYFRLKAVEKPVFHKI